MTPLSGVAIKRRRRTLVVETVSGVKHEVPQTRCRGVKVWDQVNIYWDIETQKITRVEKHRPDGEYYETPHFISKTEVGEEPPPRNPGSGALCPVSERGLAGEGLEYWTLELSDGSLVGGGCI